MAASDWNFTNEVLPADGAKVRAMLENGKIGPATYHEKTGFVLFNLPWGADSPVDRWQPWEWGPDE